MLPDAICKLTNLTTLDVSGNPLTVLCELNKGGVYGGACEWIREGGYGVCWDGQGRGLMVYAAMDKGGGAYSVGCDG